MSGNAEIRELDARQKEGKCALEPRSFFSNVALGKDRMRIQVVGHQPQSWLPSPYRYREPLKWRRLSVIGLEPDKRNKMTPLSDCN